MSYSSDVEKAKEVAIVAHSGAVDKAGAPYIYHPMRVASRMPSDEEKVVAWLHDVVEDSGVTISSVCEMFGNETAEAVEAITHRKGESWADYLVRVKSNKVATAVKLSDLTDNMNLSRLPEIKKKDVERAEKYIRAMRFLMNLDN